MRTSALSVLPLLLLLALGQDLAAANEIIYSAPSNNNPGSLQGELPLSKIGPVALPHGMVCFEKDELKVLAVPRWLFDRNLVLQGAIVRAEVVSDGNVSIIGGLVYFYSGDWLANLAKRNAYEVIHTMDGSTLRGRITGRSGSSFLILTSSGASTNVPFASIKSISAQRAFTFNIVAPSTNIARLQTSFNATAITLTQTRIPRRFLAHRQAILPVSTLAGTELAISNRTLATFVALDIMSLITPAIVTPLVLNSRTQQAGKNQLRRFAIQGQINSMRASQASMNANTGVTQ